MDRHLLIDGIRVPQLIYGTAWKEDHTQRLTTLAIESGFRGIDTANQRKHYFEEGVGNAVASSIVAGKVIRDDLFLQTKFTFQRGQDHRLPYDPEASTEQQVQQSFASSLTHLQTDRLDSYVLHGPTLREGWAPADREAWRSMEAIHQSGRVRFLGVSNVSLGQLQELHQVARVKPTFVQNRCFASQAWDRLIREFCRKQGMYYQGFSLLTANREYLVRAKIVEIARRYERTANEIAFRFALDLGMIVLTGTTKVENMRLDLEVFNFRLEPSEIDSIENLYQG